MGGREEGINEEVAGGKRRRGCNEEERRMKRGG